MSRRGELRAEPWRFGYLAVMRELERANPDKPAIGENATLSEEIVTPGQDPSSAFATSNVTGFDDGATGKPPRLRANFMGFFGPQGALPLTTTVEAETWVGMRDDSFVRFADIFATRYMQLFFRAWSNARPVAQFDRDGDDRFQDYLGSFAGLGTPAMRGRAALADLHKLPYVGLVAARVKSAARLRQMLCGVLGTPVEITEHVPTWITFEADDTTAIGANASTLGRNMRVGNRVQSVSEKIRITVKAADLPDYRRLLPGGRKFAMIADLCAWYLGPTIEVEVAPALHRDHAPAARLGGQDTALGWTGWIKPEAIGAGADKDDPWLRNATFITEQYRPEPNQAA